MLWDKAAPRPSGWICAAAVALLSGIACSPSIEGRASEQDDGGQPIHRPDGAEPTPHTLMMIAISPANDILEVDLNQPATQAFVATGHYMDGITEDLTANVVWSSLNPQAGTMVGATLAIPAFADQAAIVTKVTASFEGVVGEAQLTIVAYRKTGEKTDFFFILPFADPAGTQEKPLDFSTDIRALDVFFAVDTTGSMGEEIANLQSSLTNTIVPQIQAQIPNTQFGVGAVEDFPIDPYGSLHGTDCYFSWDPHGSTAPDQPFRLFRAITDDISQVQAGVGQLSIGGYPIGCGNDWPEGTMEALYQVATGNGLSSPSPTSVPANHTGVGGVGFRPGAMPVVIPITDASFHAVGEARLCAIQTGGGTVYESINYTGAVGAVAHNRQATKDALAAICAKVVGVSSTLAGDLAAPNCSPLADEEDFARASGARVPWDTWQGAERPASCAANKCCTDLNGAGRNPDQDGLCPLVFKISPDGSGLGQTIVTALKMLIHYAPFDVNTGIEGLLTGEGGELLPAGKTTADFIKEVRPVSFQEPPPPPELPDPTATQTGFDNVTPGTTVTFAVKAFNDFVAQTGNAQIFRATIRVTAGPCTDLDERDVLILVPPQPPGVG